MAGTPNNNGNFFRGKLMNHWILWLVDLLAVFFFGRFPFFFSENIGAEFALPDLC
jgi:hypothetical protein